MNIMPWLEDDIKRQREWIIDNRKYLRLYLLLIMLNAVVFAMNLEEFMRFHQTSTAFGCGVSMIVTIFFISEFLVNRLDYKWELHKLHSLEDLKSKYLNAPDFGNMQQGLKSQGAGK